MNILNEPNSLPPAIEICKYSVVPMSTGSILTIFISGTPDRRGKLDVLQLSERGGGGGHLLPVRCLGAH